MASGATNHKAVFRILDVMDAPYEGLILKLRLQGGEPPTIRELKGARMRASSPDGSLECELLVVGFALFGGKPSDDRLARTGRIDVHVTGLEGADHEVSARWQLEGPLR